MVATVFTPSSPLTSVDTNANISFRVLCTLSAASNGSIQVTLDPSTGGSMTCTHVSIGKWSGTGANTTTTPIELKYGGASGFTGATAPKLSDLVSHSASFGLASGDKIVVIFDIGAGTEKQAFSGSATNAESWFKAVTTSWNTATVTGFTQLTGDNYCVAKVETNSSGTANTLTAAQGSFSLSGQAATFNRGRSLAAAQGAFSLSGKASLFNRGVSIAAALGTFSMSGKAATPNAARSMTAAKGTFTVGGQATTMNRGINITAAKGSFTLNGQAVSLPRARSIAAGVGTFALNGIAATFTRGKGIAAGPGSFTVNGIAASMPVALSVKAAAGSFSLNGGGVALTYTPAGGGGAAPSHSNPFFSTPGPGMSLP